MSRHDDGVSLKRLRLPNSPHEVSIAVRSGLSGAAQEPRQRLRQGFQCLPVGQRHGQFYLSPLIFFQALLRQAFGRKRGQAQGHLLLQNEGEGRPHVLAEPGA